MRAALGALLLTMPALGTASELQLVTVDREDGTYTMHAVVRFDATLEQLYDVLIDWDLSTQFSSIVVESRDVEADEQGRPQYYSRIKTCVTFFCKDFERHGHVETEPYKWIRAYADPERSDFHISNESWVFSQDDKGAVIVTYDLEFDPKFWVPPVIGPFLVKRKLKNDGPDALLRIDTIALAQE